ncbi:unnamed protein product, partial [marine sediment metagenome]
MGINNGRVYFGNYSDGPVSGVYGLDETDGTEGWFSSAATHIWDSSPTIKDGRIFIGVRYNRLVAIDENTTEELWHFSTPSLTWVYSTAAIHNQAVFFGAGRAGSGYFYAVDATDGSEIWKYPVTGEIYGSVAVANNLVFFTTTDE